MRLFLRNWLLKALKVSDTLEQSSRERSLLKRNVALEKAVLKEREACAINVAQLEDTIVQLKSSLESLHALISSRNKVIEELEHDKELLQIDVKGMTSINARLAKWIETLRTAEEKPLGPDHDLHRQLADIESAVPWETT